MKYKTKEFDDQVHVMVRRLTGNVTLGHLNNVNRILKNRTSSHQCGHTTERCGCLKGEIWRVSQFNENFIEIQVIYQYNV